MLKRLKAESSLNAAELLAIAELLICAEDAVKYYEDLFEDSLTAMYSSLDPITTLSRSIKNVLFPKITLQVMQVLPLHRLENLRKRQRTE